MKFEFPVQIFLSLHRAFCSLFNYTHQQMHIYVYII